MSDEHDCGQNHGNTAGLTPVAMASLEVSFIISYYFLSSKEIIFGISPPDVFTSFVVLFAEFNIPIKP